MSAYSGRAGGNQETPSPTAHSRGDRPRQHSSRPGRCTRPRRAQRQWYEAPKNPRRPHHPRLVPKRDGPVEDRTAMEHAAVLVRSPADVRRDQPEHPQSLETQRTTSSTARQEYFALTGKHDTAERAHLAGVRRRVHQGGDDQEPGARKARRRVTRRPSQLQLGEAALAWHALELQEARQMRESAPQHRAAARQHAPALHQAVLADGQASCQRRSSREHRRDFLPPAGVKQAQQQGNTKEATTFTVAFSMDRGALDMLVQIVHAGKTDAVLP